jgi:hypothetical protein
MATTKRERMAKAVKATMMTELAKVVSAMSLSARLLRAARVIVIGKSGVGGGGSAAAT